MKPQMKFLPVYAAVVCALLATSCAQFQNVQTVLGSPQQVQADVTALGSIAKSRLPDSAKTQIHVWATRLNQVAYANTAELRALIPHTGNLIADAFIASAGAFLDLAIAKFGQHNAVTLSYIHAVANGLLSQF